MLASPRAQRHQLLGWRYFEQIAQADAGRRISGVDRVANDVQVCTHAQLIEGSGGTCSTKSVVEGEDGWGPAQVLVAGRLQVAKEDDARPLREPPHQLSKHGSRVGQKG
jgi:hypothetical protein